MISLFKSEIKKNNDEALFHYILIQPKCILRIMKSKWKFAQLLISDCSGSTTTKKITCK